MGPAHPPKVVENDPAGLPTNPSEVCQRGFGSSPRGLTTPKRLHDVGGKQGSGDALTLAGESHAPDLIIRVEAAARQRRVPDPPWKGVIKAPGRCASRDPAGAVQGHTAYCVMIVCVLIRAIRAGWD